jgi:hypothetical protein
MGEVNTEATQVPESNTPIEAPAEPPKASNKAKKAKAPRAEKHATSAFEVGETGLLTDDQKKAVVLVTDEADPLWDPKMKLKVPQEIVDAFEDPQFGWDRSMPLRIRSDGRIAQGRTKWRAALKVGLDKLEIPFVVIDDEDEILSMRQGVRLNEHVQVIDPMTRAESIARMLSAGVEEKQVAQDHAISVNDMHGHLLLLDLKESIQELVRTGQMPFAAAVEFHRRNRELPAAVQDQLANEIVKAAQGGVKVNSSVVKKAGGEEKVATRKDIKQQILDLQSNLPTDKVGRAAHWGAIVAIEMCLGTRSVKQFENAIVSAAHSKEVKVNFKQYQDGAKPPEEKK